MSTQVPKSIIVAVAKSLQKNEPTLELLNLLVFAGFGDRAAELPENLQMPLFLLRHLDERRVSIPESCVFINGLRASSVSFWMCVLKKESKDAKRLLGRVLKHGDDSSKCLASLFYEPVAHRMIFGALDEDFYQAMLARFRFTPACNEYVIQNYRIILINASHIGWRFI